VVILTHLAFKKLKIRFLAIPNHKGNQDLSFMVRLGIISLACVKKEHEYA